MPSQAKTSLLMFVLAMVGFGACGGPEGRVVDSLDDSTVELGLTSVPSFGSNPGGLAMYRYVPAAMPTGAPVVVVLHGCTQTAADYEKTGWNALADTYKFYVVYVEQTTGNNALRCFNWAGEYGDPTNLQRGQGENESIKQMVDKMKADFSVNPARVFVSGFSGGGAQAALMLAVWPDVFAAGATLAGIPYNCTTTYSEVSGCLKPGKTLSPTEWGNRVRAASSYTGPWPRLAIWQGTADSVVDPNNTTQLLHQWSNVHGIDETAELTDTSVTGTTRKEYRDAQGKALVETWAVTGMDHGIPVDPANGCGTAQAYILNKGICSSFYIARFFGLTGGNVPYDGGVPLPDAGKPDSGLPDAGPSDAGLPDAGPPDAGLPDAGGQCTAVTDSTYNLVASGKAVRCGSYNMYACAGGTQLGLWNLFVKATVHSTNGTSWLAGPCR